MSFDGLARACAKAGGFPEPELVHFEPKDFDFGKKKAFPMRSQVSTFLCVVFLSLSSNTPNSPPPTNTPPQKNNLKKPNKPNN